MNYYDTSLFTIAIQNCQNARDSTQTMEDSKTLIMVGLSVTDLASSILAWIESLSVIPFLTQMVCHPRAQNKHSHCLWRQLQCFYQWIYGYHHTMQWACQGPSDLQGCCLIWDTQLSPKMQYLQKQKTWLLYTLLFAALNNTVIAPKQLSLPYISEDHSRIPEINSWQRKFIYLSL